MKKIIKGRVYDTDTAKKICSDDDQPIGNWSTTLYQKKTGEFFEHYWGIWENTGDVIIPLSYEEAKKWVEKHGDSSIYEALFCIEEDDDDSKTALNLNLSESTIKKAKNTASKIGITVSKYIEELIEESSKE